MYTDEFWAKTRRIWEEAYSRGNLVKLNEVVAPGYIRHRPPFGDIVGLGGLKRFIEEVRTSYPDCKLTLGESITQGAMAATRWTFEGTQRGPSPTTGVPPTGKHVIFTGCTFDHYEEGKLVESWEHGDYLGLLQTLDPIAMMAYSAE